MASDELMLRETIATDAGISPRLRSFAATDPSLLIGGELASVSARVPIKDPSMGHVIYESPMASAQDVDDAFSSAMEAQSGWAALGPYARFETLLQAADLIEKYAHDFALLDAIDSGNPITAMETDVRLGLRHLRYFSALGLSSRGETQDFAGGGVHYSLREPFGVVARIVPFNHPAMFAIGKIAPPLIAGNTVLMKPAEQTPLSALYLATLLNEVLPPGVVNVVPGGVETGVAIVRHPRIKRITFMGSVLTGLRVQQTAASVCVKHVSLELGGKNPMIVCADADLDRAVVGAVMGMNFGVCQGQSCGSNSRILIHDSLFDRFVEALSGQLAEIRVGVAYDSVTEMGPLVDERQYERVMGFVDRGKAEARLIFGGNRPADVPSAGFFLEPTLFEVAGAEELARDEIFGPVVVVARWHEEDEVLRLANSLQYGLTASVWSRDIVTANRLVRGLDAGYVWVNEHGMHYLGTPFGGRKESGVGEEESLSEIESFLQTKSVHVAAE